MPCIVSLISSSCSGVRIFMYPSPFDEHLEVGLDQIKILTPPAFIHLPNASSCESKNDSSRTAFVQQFPISIHVPRLHQSICAATSTCSRCSPDTSSPAISIKDALFGVVSSVEYVASFTWTDTHHDLSETCKQIDLLVCNESRLVLILCDDQNSSGIDCGSIFS